jgi:hypothetical protein
MWSCCTFWIKVVMWKMVKKDEKYPSIHPSGIHPINSFATFAFGERETVRLLVNGKKCRHVAHSR